MIPLTLLVTELCGLVVERRLHETIALHVGLDGRQLLKPKINIINSIFSSLLQTRARSSKNGFLPVLGIQIRIRWIPMFLGLPDPHLNPLSQVVIRIRILSSSSKN
jgi:hypothetical protein